MAISFNYKTIKRPDGTSTRCPIIPLTLYGKETIEYLGLLDSGADISAIHVSVAELLELDLSGPDEEAFGIGGKVKSKTSKIRLFFKKGHERSNLTIPVKVIYDENDFGVMLLGRKGFFENFVITFKERQEKFTLKKAPKR